MVTSDKKRMIANDDVKCPGRACPLAPVLVVIVICVLAAIQLVEVQKREKTCKPSPELYPCNLLQYYHGHLDVSIFMFCFGACLYWLLVRKFRQNPMWVVGSSAVFKFVLGRVTRDFEKFGKMRMKWGLAASVGPAVLIACLALLPLIAGILTCVARKEAESEDLEAPQEVAQNTEQPASVIASGKTFSPNESMPFSSNESDSESDAKTVCSGCDECTSPVPPRALRIGLVALSVGCALLLPLYAMGSLPYFVWEAAMFILVFVIASCIHQPMESLGFCGIWLAAWWCGVMFYTGREIRDLQQLGYWDAPGLNWPLFGLTVLFVILQLVHVTSLWISRRRAKKRSDKDQIIVEE